MGRKIKVILQPVKFRKKDHIALLSPNNSEIDDVVREFDNSEWSTGYRFWHLPYKNDTLKQINEAFKEVAIIDSSALKNYQFNEESEKTERKKRIKTPKPSLEQQLKLEKFKSEFLSKGYSDGTIKVYMCMLKVFFGWFKDKRDFEITSKDIERFLNEYIEANNFTINYKRLMTNSLRRYFNFTNRTDIKNLY